MLTLLVGTDTAARTKRFDALVDSFLKRGVDVRRYTDVEFNPEELKALSGARSLFDGALAVVITGVGDTADMRDELESLFAVFAESEHAFVLSENALPASIIKKAEAVGATVETFSEKAKFKKAEVFNSFLLTDAFSERKRSLAWALYRKAIDLGVEPRELHGKLFWCVKTMLVTSTAASVGESGLNPFVYQKSKSASRNFAPGELESLLRELAVLFHEALVSGFDLEASLESFILRSLAK